MSGLKHGAASFNVRPPLPLPTTVTSAAMTIASTIAPRALTPPNDHVSDDTWAKAIHAVKVQKMSLRNAAQLYGVHHMSLHRRVRGRYATASAGAFDIRLYLSERDEAEVLGVLREQFLHERRITSDDIRFVVRAIASHGGQRAVPPEFPPSRWIAEFKRAHGFAKLNSYAYPPVAARSSASESGGDLDDDDDDDDDRNSESSGSSTSYAPPPRYPVPSFRRESQQQPPHVTQELQSHEQLEVQQQQLQAKQQRTQQQQARSSRPWDDDDTGLTTGSSSCSSFEGSEQQQQQQPSTASVPPTHATLSTVPTMSSSRSHKTSSITGSESSQHSHQTQNSQQQRSYKLSHTVPPETWDKAIAAVEQQGMSLRAAAKAYGVHFAALHRRVKKRAQGDASAPLEGYFHPDDEAGIIRVVVARAELGVLMTFDELMDLVQRAALRNLPDISVDAARKLMARFQSRNEHSVRHIIVDWPLPRISAMRLDSSSSISSNGSSNSVAKPTVTRVVRAPSRPAVIVTNTSGDAAATLAATPFGTALPPAHMLAAGLNVRDAGAPPPMLPVVAPLRGELQTAHSLFLRAPPPPPLAAPTSASSTHSAKRSTGKGSSVMFV